MLFRGAVIVEVVVYSGSSCRRRHLSQEAFRFRGIEGFRFEKAEALLSRDWRSSTALGCSDCNESCRAVIAETHVPSFFLVGAFSFRVQGFGLGFYDLSL